MNTDVQAYSWTAYRRRRLHFIFGLVATAGVMASMGWVEEQSRWLGPIVWFTWMIAVIGPLIFRFALTPCPRCGKPVHYRNGFGYPFSPKCLSCGIKVGSTIDGTDKIN